MKDYIQTLVIFVIFLALIPCLVFVAGVQNSSAQDTSESTQEFTVGVYFTKEKSLVVYSMEEYLTGAVLAQMPADFEQEALKAQAVLARTYIQRRYESEKASPTASLHGALISDDEQLYQAFFTNEQAEDFYGEDFDNAYQRANAAAKSAGFILTYEDEPVIAAYHAASSGYTESALTAWGQEIPYLQAVESQSDRQLAGIETTVCVTQEQLAKTLDEKLDIDLSGDFDENTISLSQVNERGYVTQVTIEENDIAADEFTELFDIASPCFECVYKDGEFIFTSLGFGHLVGMSQYGANSMAQQGADFSEILNYYYTDCEIVKAQ